MFFEIFIKVKNCYNLDKYKSKIVVLKTSYFK